jgi:hypothetical protein
MFARIATRVSTHAAALMIQHLHDIQRALALDRREEEAEADLKALLFD